MMFNLQRFLPDVLSPDCLVNENHRFYMNMAQKSVLSHRVGTEAFAPDKLHEHQRVDNALDRAVREETLQQSFLLEVSSDHICPEPVLANDGASL